MLAVSDRCWGRCWRSWRLLEPLLALLGRLGHKKVEEHDHFENVLISRAGARSGAWGAVLRRSWGLCWRSWVALGPSVGGLGPLLEPTLAILGRSWNLCWRSWDVLGPKRSVLGRSGRSWEGIRAEKWPKPEREQAVWRRGPRANVFGRRDLLSIFFCRYIYIYIYTPCTLACTATLAEMKPEAFWLKNEN